jgi:hypothetical protein
LPILSKCFVKWKFGQKASTTEARLIVNERFPALNPTPVTTSVREAKSAANLYLEYKICQLEAVDSMSGLSPVEEDDGRHCRQQDMTTAGVAGESRANYAPTRLGAKRKAAHLTMSESRLSRIKGDDASHSRQKDMRTASVAGMSRVDVHATISDRCRALRVKLDAARRFRSSLPRFRSPKAKPEEHLIDGPSM